MINMSNITGKVYGTTEDGKQRLFTFNYDITDNDSFTLRCIFCRASEVHPDNGWCIDALFAVGPSGSNETILQRHFRVAYIMPKYGMPVEMVIATGLEHIRSLVINTYQMCNNINAGLIQHTAGQVF